MGCLLSFACLSCAHTFQDDAFCSLLCGHEGVVVEEFKCGGEFVTEFRSSLGKGGGNFHGKCRNAGDVGRSDAEQAFVVEL